MNHNSNRTNQFVKNVIGSAILQVITIITGFISPKLMLQSFGSEINGITTSILQFISYLTLVEAGLGNATIFALYKPLANHDAKERDEIVSATRIAYYRIGFIFVAMSVVLAFVYPFIGKTTVLGYWEMFFLVLILCANSTVNFFVLAKYRSLLTADQCGYIVSISSGVQLLTNLAIIYISIKAGLNVIAVRGLAILSFGVTTLILSLMVRKRYGKINYHAAPNMKALNKRWDAMANQLIGVVNSGAPVIIMTTLLNFKQLSVYSIYNMVVGAVNTGITVFTSGLAASFGNIYALGDEKLLRKTTDEFRTTFYILITTVYATTLVLLVPFVRIYTSGVNDVNYVVPLFGFLIAMNGILDNFKAPYGMLVYSLGKFREIRRPTIIQALLTIVLCISLTRLWGLEGCMLGFCLSSVYMLVEFLFIAPKHLVKMSVPKNILQILFSLFIMLFSYWIFHMYGYQPESYLNWVIYAIIVFAVNACITFVLYFIIDRKNMISLFHRFKGYLPKGLKK